MSAARRSYRSILAGVVLVGAAGAGRAARADEPADRGISLSTWVGGALDRSVTAAGNGRPVNEGAPVVGAFRDGATLWRKGGLTVEASNSHSDYFRKDLTALRAEERIAGTVQRPKACFK